MPLVASKLDPALAVVDEICPAGEPWTRLIRLGQVFRILDLEGNQAVDTLFYSADDPQERAVALWGALAMALTAAVGALFGVTA